MVACFSLVMQSSENLLHLLILHCMYCALKFALSGKGKKVGFGEKITGEEGKIRKNERVKDGKILPNDFDRTH